MDNQKDQIQIRQHNIITGGRQDLTAVQMDIYFMFLSKLKKDANNYLYNISLLEIQRLTGREWHYNQLKEATNDMVEKGFYIKNKKGNTVKVTMFASAEYIDGKGYIELEISQKLKPYLLDLKDNFTSFQLFSVLSMTSKYAKWVYILLSRWKDVGIYAVTVDDLKYSLSLKGVKGEVEQYKQWGQFKDNVLEQAVKQINKYSDLKVSYTTEKRSRLIYRVIFDIKRVKNFQVVIPYELNEADQEAITLKTRLNQIGIVDDKIIKQVLGSADLRKKAFKTLFEMKNQWSSIRNKAGWFRTSMGI